ncbi:MAG: WecB/TagA/CpsF family glycosyltransferase [Deltaproteobacteria bacterium]|nr:WecB/TagA/CpsF family glycosyltransferase [Deltaproteobacteria bacterium]
MSVETLQLGPVPVHAVTMAQALDLILDRRASGVPGYVLTPNVDHVVLARQDASLAAAYRDVFLSLADGMPILWAARALGRPLPEKVSGSDLVVPLLERAAREHCSIYLLGGRAGSGPEAARRIAQRWPTLRIAGVDAPFINATADDDASRAAFDRVVRASPDLLLVGLGCPKQERWIHRYSCLLPGTVSLGIGASIDFLAGAVPRAPAWMSRSGLEWLYRLSREPRRLWRRYLVRDPAFFWIVGRLLLARAPEAA